MGLRRNDIISWKLRLVISVIISLVPSNFLRILLHRIVNGYKISRSGRVGFGTILAVDEARIGSATIKMFNVFQGPFSLLIEDGVTISVLNTFRCGQWVVDEEELKKNVGLLRYCRLRKNASINMGHFIDATGGFELGEGSQISGRDSQFWTHGAGVADKSIVIGSNCFIGSAARFAPGSIVGDHCMVGLGSVVTEKFNGNHLLIAGVPAKVIKDNYDWRRHMPLEEYNELPTVRAD
jgi:acetyltransferase-like isoleucine patch superfamily enzyme